MRPGIVVVHRWRDPLHWYAPRKCYRHDVTNDRRETGLIDIEAVAEAGTASWPEVSLKRVGLAAELALSEETEPSMMVLFLLTKAPMKAVAITCSY